MTATATATPSEAPATAWRTITFREALRAALGDEMARDDRVFLMGEEVGVFGGAYKVSAGLLDEFGPKRVHRHPDLRGGVRRRRHRGSPAGAATGGRDHDVQLPAWWRWTRWSTTRPNLALACAAAQVRVPARDQDAQGRRHSQLTAQPLAVVRRHGSPARPG